MSKYYFFFFFLLYTYKIYLRYILVYLMNDYFNFLKCLTCITVSHHFFLQHTWQVHIEVGKVPLQWAPLPHPNVESSYTYAYTIEQLRTRHKTNTILPVYLNYIYIYPTIYWYIRFLQKNKKKKFIKLYK